MRRLSSGSSPLARGLLLRRSVLGSAGGIIPARAGFTTRFWPRWRRRRDHPRSRGVYESEWNARSSTRGSSPLARGLLVEVAVEDVLGRIIPARAGFTGRGSVRVPGHRDHPRSRGVYRTSTGSWVPSSGSSPLARGLRGDAAPPVGCGGIIPARAGFTRRPPPRGWRRGDHPRSRGVYPPTPSGGCRSWGSSPLARGLP